MTLNVDLYDAELQNIRVKVDGKSASSAGAAVREQITSVMNDCKDRYDEVKEDIDRVDNNTVKTNGNTVENILDNIFDANTSTEGYYLLNDGITKRENVAYSHSDYISINGYKKIKFSGFVLTCL